MKNYAAMDEWCWDRTLYQLRRVILLLEKGCDPDLPPGVYAVPEDVQ